ncbi:hypothetical protein [Hyphomonas sp.]|uniref:hypothetical protein n=1 Tax=Hyphomonas sp. TaxID=87 RepID=UPI0032F09B86
MRIVTGMHRSGTSFVCQCLSALGADFGDPALLFPADKWNQAGYFENVELIDIDNKLILGKSAKIENWLNAPEGLLGRVINSFQSMKWKYFLFPGRDKIIQRSKHFTPEMKALARTYAGTYVKDPRFCLTLGAWVDVGAVESVVFSFRNPGAVAGSIRRREGLPRWFGHKYWIYHIQGFFADLPPETPLFVVDFDAFFLADQQAEAFARLRRFMGVPDSETAERDLKGRLELRLRTQADPIEKLPEREARVYAALVELCERCGNAPMTIADHEDIRQRIMQS